MRYGLFLPNCPVQELPESRRKLPTKLEAVANWLIPPGTLERQDLDLENENINNNRKVQFPQNTKNSTEYDRLESNWHL